MSSLNKVTLIGNLGLNPELKTTTGGRLVTTLSLATHERWKRDGTAAERTDWHRVVLWGRLAEVASQHLSKGRRVYIEGRLQTRSWEDQNGSKRFAMEIVASRLRFLDSSKPDTEEEPF